MNTSKELLIDAGITVALLLIWYALEIFRQNGSRRKS